MTVAELYATFGFSVDQRSIGQVKSALESVTKLAKGFVAALGARAIVGFIDHATEAATHLVSMSQAMGMTIAQTQEWGYVAQQSGSSLRELSMGMNQFVRYLRLFSRGEGGNQLAGRMREIGISVADAKDALASPAGLDRVLMRVSDHLKGMGNNAERAALGTQLFGARAGRAMIADMARGSAGVQELRDHFKSLGAELSDSEALGLRALGNRLKDLKTQWDGFLAHTIARLAPIIEATLDGISTVVTTISDLFQRAFAGDDGAIAIVTGLAVAISAVVLPALASMAVAVIAATWPFLVIAAVVAAIAYGVIKLVKNWDAVSDAVQAAARWVRDEFEELIAWLDDNFVQPLEGAWDAFRDAAQRAYDYVTSLDWAKAIPILGPLGEFLGRKAAQALGGKEGGRDATSDDMPDVDTIVHSDGTIEHRTPMTPADMAAPTRAVPGAAPIQTGAGAEQVTNNVHAPLTVNITGVPNAERAVEGMDAALQRQWRHAFAGTGQ